MILDLGAQMHRPALGANPGPRSPRPGLASGNGAMAHVKHTSGDTVRRDPTASRPARVPAGASRATRLLGNHVLDEVEALAGSGSYSLDIGSGRWVSTNGLDAILRTRRRVRAVDATRAGCEVIAEGIEHSGECKMLRELGVGLGQGYLLGRGTASAPLRDTSACLELLDLLVRHAHGDPVAVSSRPTTPWRSGGRRRSPTAHRDFPRRSGIRRTCSRGASRAAPT